MIAFSIGPIHIYRYGIFYFLGFIFAYFFLKQLGKKSFLTPRPKLQKLLNKHTDDILIASILGVLIGGRIGHVLIYDRAYFRENLREIFAVRHGGMAFIGGMIGVSLAFLVLKKIKKLSRAEFMLLLDCILITVPIGIMLGRIGNFLNQELYGVIVHPETRNIGQTITTRLQQLHLIHIYPTVGEEWRVNTNFLASAFEGLATFLILFFLNKKRIKTKKISPGFLTAVFLLRYSFVRFLLEYFRQGSQDQFVARFTRSQRFFIIFFALGLGLLIKIKRKKQS